MVGDLTVEGIWNAERAVRTELFQSLISSAFRSYSFNSDGRCPLIGRSEFDPEGASYPFLGADSDVTAHPLNGDPEQRKAYSDSV
jgi:hypothetical protein